MNERLVAYTLNITDPVEADTVGDAAAVVMLPFGATLIYASVSAHDDDPGASIDIQDDGTDIVTAIDATDQDVPGEWASIHAGGSNAPIAIAAGSEIDIDVNAAAAANRFDVLLLFLTGETWG